MHKRQVVKRARAGQTALKTLDFGPDYPEFRPNLTPKQIFELGSFGGTYFRPIYSSIADAHFKNPHREFSCLQTLPEHLLIQSKYDVNLNKYKVEVGTSLEFWEEKGWITAQDPYGWVQWYCRFYEGRRSPDDARQISRWVKTAGPKSRFRARLLNMLADQGKSVDDYSVSPKIRQVLQHWGYQITQEDLEAAIQGKQRVKTK